MSATVWWARESSAPLPEPVGRRFTEAGELVEADTASRHRAIGRLREGYTPDWRPRSADDPGARLSVAVSAAAAAVARQVNRLPERRLRELLNMGGLATRGQVPTSMAVAIQVDRAAIDPVGLPERSVLFGPERGDGRPSTFETTRAVLAQPLSLQAVVVETGTATRFIPVEPTVPLRFAPFGSEPVPGNAIRFGFAGRAGPGPFAIHLQFDGEVVASARPSIVWSVLLGGIEEPVRVLLDETRSATSSGIVEVQLPARWDLETAPGEPTPLRWLVARLRSGAFSLPPVLAAVEVNSVRAEGVETRRNEPLDRVEEPTDAPGIRDRYVLSQTPVLQGSLSLIVQRTNADPFGGEQAAEDERWIDVPSFERVLAGSRVVMVEPLTGEITFPIDAPRSFRRVLAERYIVAAPTAAISAGTLLTIDSAPLFVPTARAIGAIGASATNEPIESALDRGPALVRTKGRATTATDFETLALDVAGVSIRRADALPGRSADGTPRPGSVLVVVAAMKNNDQGYPVPLQSELTAIHDSLRSQAAQGIEIAVVVARFVRIRVEAEVLVRSARDPSTIASAAADAIDGYLLSGPGDRPHFELGGIVRHRELAARIGALEGVLEAELRISVDGRRLGNCEDAPLPLLALPLPAAHLLTVSIGVDQ